MSKGTAVMMARLGTRKGRRGGEHEPDYRTPCAYGTESQHRGEAEVGDPKERDSGRPVR